MLDAGSPLLPKENALINLPTPPPAITPDTCYSFWKNTNCIPDKLEHWKYEPSRATRWAAKTYDGCMTPGYCYDKVIYKCCCCGDSSNCQCHEGGCAPFPMFFICLSHLPKLPFVVLGAASALGTGIAGGIKDCTSAAPPREVMDPTEVAVTSQESKSIESFSTKLGKLTAWLVNEDLPAIVTFLIHKENLALVCSSTPFYEKKIFLFCLLIRSTTESVNLQQRIQLMQALMKGDPEIINGYHSSQGWVVAPLLEATRSQYIHASEILEFLCESGARVRFASEHTRYKPESPLLQKWLYHDLLLQEPMDEELFYRGLLLKHYENTSEQSYEFKRYLLQDSDPKYAILDKQLTQLADKEIKRSAFRVILKHELESKHILPTDVVKITGQYIGLFSPKQKKTASVTTEVEVKDKESKELEGIDLPAESKRSTKVDWLQLFQPLPPFAAPPPPPEPRPSTGDIPIGIL